MRGRIIAKTRSSSSFAPGDPQGPGYDHEGDDECEGLPCGGYAQDDAVKTRGDLDPDQMQVRTQSAQTHISGPYLPDRMKGPPNHEHASLAFDLDLDPVGLPYQHLDAGAGMVLEIL
jgi:hypothetical protein